MAPAQGWHARIEQCKRVQQQAVRPRTPDKTKYIIIRRTHKPHNYTHIDIRINETKNIQNCTWKTTMPLGSSKGSRGFLKTTHTVCRGRSGMDFWARNQKLWEGDYPSCSFEFGLEFEGPLCLSETRREETREVDTRGDKSTWEIGA